MRIDNEQYLPETCEGLQSKEVQPKLGTRQMNLQNCRSSVLAGFKNSALYKFYFPRAHSSCENARLTECYLICLMHKCELHHTESLGATL